MDMLVLADRDGIVDMTHEAISRRTNVPIETIKACIIELEKPDPRSRSPEHNGARLFRLDEHRDWGWCIANYGRYRAINSDETYRAAARNRVARYRENLKEKEPKRKSTDTDTDTKALVTFCNNTLRNVTYGHSLGFLLVFKENKAFFEAWERWEQHRTEIRHKLTPTCRMEQLKKLAKWGPDKSIASINESISQGWQGLFEPKSPAIPNRPPADTRCLADKEMDAVKRQMQRQGYEV